MGVSTRSTLDRYRRGRARERSPVGPTQACVKVHVPRLTFSPGPASRVPGGQLAASWRPVQSSRARERRLIALNAAHELLLVFLLQANAAADLHKMAC